MAADGAIIFRWSGLDELTLRPSSWWLWSLNAKGKILVFAEWLHCNWTCAALVSSARACILHIIAHWPSRNKPSRRSDDLKSWTSYTETQIRQKLVTSEYCVIRVFDPNKFEWYRLSRVRHVLDFSSVVRFPPPRFFVSYCVVFSRRIVIAPKWRRSKRSLLR